MEVDQPCTHVACNHYRIEKNNVHLPSQEVTMRGQEVALKIHDAVVYLQSAISTGNVALVDRVEQFIGSEVKWLYKRMVLPLSGFTMRQSYRDSIANETHRQYPCCCRKSTDGVS